MEREPFIAIVDDEEDVLASLSALFKDAGFRVRCFPSGMALLSAIASGPVAVILSDQHMPAMSGLDMIRRLRADGNETPVILVTAYATPAIHTLARSLRVAEVVEKPFQPAALLAAVRSVARLDHS